MSPWHIASRRHSFMPSSPPSSALLSQTGFPPSGPGSLALETLEPNVRNSVVSLDEGQCRERRKESDMLTVPTAQSKVGGSGRFSILGVRHKSDSQLNQTASQHASIAPPIPMETPTIMRTAPTHDVLEPGKRRSTFLLPRRPKTPKTPANSYDPMMHPDSLRVTFDGGDRGAVSLPRLAGPPAYEDATTSQLAVPVARVSDSSRSDESSGNRTIYGQTTTVTHTTQTTTTFFRLPGRKKNKGHLFPLPPKTQSPSSGTGNTPNLSASHFSGSDRQSLSYPDAGTPGSSPRRSGQHSPAKTGSWATPVLGRSNSRHSSRSTHSAQRILPGRGRASTAGSAQRLRQEAESTPVPPVPASTRTSISTAGRPSLAGLFSLSRLRQSSEPALRNGTSTAPDTPMSAESNPFLALPNLPSMVLPERQEGDTPARYLTRLEEIFTRGALVPVLSKTDDEFMRNVLRSYMRRFKFFEEPIDMAVRKLLMQIELPKETQQIDRTLQAFADRYHECNPGIFQSPDEAYFIAFSILILHTDVFNKNNKRKMQKADYLKNTSSQGVAPEILACFYDNVAYTPFIHLDDDTEFIAEKLMTQRRKTDFKSSSTASLRSKGQPVDPYALILDGKLDILRVAVEDVVAMDDPFNYLGTAKVLNHAETRRAFFRSGVIQILSSRSRPDAFSNQATIKNPSEAQVGVVDMKVTKVGVLWRKDPKKRKTRSPWQEWGAILTGSQLYFFRNKDWVKSLMHQYESHQRSGRGRGPVVFQPAIDNFKPDFLISTENLVALVDTQYKRHKNAFVVSRENIFQEVFLADNEFELNDWLAKLNYLAAFRTSGVRMRGITGGTSAESQISGDILQAVRPQTGASETTGSISMKGKQNADMELARQIAEARRRILTKKLDDMTEKLISTDRLLDSSLRTARHMSVLTPIQEKTRQDVLSGAAKLSANIRWERMNRWRVRCHRDILHVDLEQDLKSETGGPETEIEGEPLSQEVRDIRSRIPFGRFNSKTGGGSAKPMNKDNRVSLNSPNATAKFLNNVEEMFRTPSRSGHPKHHAKGSWELPPLTFDRRGSEATVPTNANTSGSAVEVSEDRQKPFNKAEDLSRAPSLPNATATALAVTDTNESENQQCRTLEPLPTAATLDRVDDDACSSDTEPGGTLRPSQLGLQTRFPSSTGSGTHRLKKDKGSSSTVNTGTSEEVVSLHTSEEGLARSPGSFTLHGKKASIVTFGSEWQKLSGEEGLRARKSTITAGPPSPEELLNSGTNPEGPGAKEDATVVESRPVPVISASPEYMDASEAVVPLADGSVKPL